MKVVLICHAQEHSGQPDPMYYKNGGPSLLKIMKYYANYGYKDFVLCLGEHGDVVKNYFLNFKNFTPVDFVLTSGSVINLLGTDIDDWNIMFDDNAGITNRPRNVFDLQKYLKFDRYFLINDDVTSPEGPLDDLISQFKRSQKTGMRLGNSTSFIFRKSVLDKLQQDHQISMNMFTQLEKNAPMTISNPSLGNALVYL